MTLATDLYELAMASSYRALDMHARATFSLFVRKLPRGRSYLVAAGLEEALARITSLRLDPDEVEWLVASGTLQRAEAESIARVRFTGDAWAVPEGRVVFANEPLLEVDAPIIEAQLVETLVLNAMHFPTTVATKAARCVTAARGATLVEFGLRRAPGIEAGLAVARASFLAGFDATSNVLAGRRYDIPVSGTVAHAFIEAMPSERTAFEAWMRTAHAPITLLVDTYDTITGVRRAVEIASEMRRADRRVAAIRLDSGDLDALSRVAREILDRAGLHDVRIFASGGLDENAIDRLVRARAPIDGFGVGTHVGVAADAPVLDMAYKLVEYDGEPRLKLSAGKATLVGPKQVWRLRDAHGRFVEDRIAARDEPAPGPEWEPLLERVIERGGVFPLPTLAQLRERHAHEMASLDDDVKALEATRAYSVSISPTLVARQRDAVDTARAQQ